MVTDWFIYVILPSGEKYTDVLDAVSHAAYRAAEGSNAQVAIRERGRFPPHRDREKPDHLIASASLVIADTTGADPKVLYELGLVQSQEKPLILIHQDDDLIPSVLSEYQTLLYDRSRLIVDLVPRLGAAIAGVLSTGLPDSRPAQQGNGRDAKRVFVSYSHEDREALDRLLIHLRPLQRNGTLDVWDDTQIKAGDRWEQEIENALSRSAIAVLLVSADFMASDFIIDNELPPLLEGAREKGTRILPVVLNHCRFTRDSSNLSQFQAVNDPAQPLLSLSRAEQERIWDNVAYAVETEI